LGLARDSTPDVYTEYEGEIRKQGDTILIRPVRPGPYLHTITLREIRKQGDTILIRPVRPEAFIVDKALVVHEEVDDIMAIQSDLDLFDQRAKCVADKFRKKIHLTPPCLFAAQVVNVSVYRKILSAKLVYGILPLDPFQQATRIVLQGKREGLTDEKILEKLARVSTTVKIPPLR
jgi:hypothetical protein